MQSGSEVREKAFEIIRVNRREQWFTSIFAFSHNVFERLNLPLGCLKLGLYGNGLTMIPNKLELFNNPDGKGLGKLCGKFEKKSFPFSGRKPINLCQPFPRQS